MSDKEYLSSKHGVGSPSSDLAVPDNPQNIFMRKNDLTSKISFVGGKDKQEVSQNR